jgi:iron complex outermembrane recepter protein
VARLSRVGLCAGIAILLASVDALAASSEDRAASKFFWFDIPGEPLVAAIAEFSRQTHVSVGSASTDLASSQSKPVRGYLTLDDALNRLLAGTGKTFRFVNPGAVAILPATGSGDKGAGRLAPPAAEMRPVLERPYIIDVVVTATKLRSHTEDLPAAISVVEGGSLEDLGVGRASGLSSQIPGLMTTNQGPGRNKLFIRGLSDGAFTGQTQSAVGVYLDAAPMTYNDPYPDIRLVDIDRVEVLKGPQGTLYGAGAISGVFRVVPNFPDLGNVLAQATLSGSATHDGGLNRAAEAFINVPLAEDVLGIRIAGSTEHDQGYIDDIRLQRSNVNDSAINAVRTILRWRPGEIWTVDVIGMLQRTELDDTQYFVQGLGRYNRDNYVAEPYSDFFKLANAKFTGELGWSTLTSSTTVVRRENRARNDATLAVVKFIDIPLTPSPFDTRRDIDTLSEEVRLSSQGLGRVDWLVGASYLRRGESGGFQLTVPGSNAAQITSLPNDAVFSEDRSDHVREAALFSNVSIDLGVNIRLGAGARFFRSRNVTSATVATVSDPIPQQLSGRSIHSGITPQATLSYRPRDDFLIYAAASQGYRNGGVNINTPLAAVLGFEPDETTQKINAFDPDNLWNFELGLKKEWLDNRLRLNGAAFYVLWQGVQTDQYLANGLPYVLNAGDATNFGFEIDASALVTDNLEVAANVFWNSPQLSQGNAFLGAVRGDRLPGIAAFTAGASVTYSFDLGHDLHGKLSGRYAYTGRSYLMFGDQSPTMGNYHEGDFRLEIGRGEWSAGAFMQNSWSETGNSFSFGNPFSQPYERQVTPLRPLTVGLTIRVEY